MRAVHLLVLHNTPARMSDLTLTSFDAIFPSGYVRIYEVSKPSLKPLDSASYMHRGGLARHTVRSGN